ncbi:hypothetical protein [Chryseobacterium lathyri]|uniref:C1q domain-containing protein n=1 Tax=Chryseobacterium lathyri TaxID=395933 RepID=A0ABT9SRS9_9FLAO|nr:hypothetical protein [Chryseobacterium lathyri]MDP9961165.1 hypothetical protein [Chryseobacterium lathyri]
MKKKQFFLASILLLSVNAYSQVGINTATPNPSAILDVVSASKGLLIPRISLTSNTDIITVPNPTNGLLVFNLADAGSGANRVVRNNLYKFNSTTNKWELMLDENAMNALSIPAPAVFRLSGDINSFLNGYAEGSSQLVPMDTVKNQILGLSYDNSTSTLTFPAGTYKMEFVYEANHNISGCTISSYFIDFPDGASTTRIHSTASHMEGTKSNHGGTISYTTTLPANKTWQIKLGRGQSGNCMGTGGTLVGRRTEVLIFKIGD